MGIKINLKKRKTLDHSGKRGSETDSSGLRSRERSTKKINGTTPHVRIENNFEPPECDHEGSFKNSKFANSRKKSAKSSAKKQAAHSVERISTNQIKTDEILLVSKPRNFDLKQSTMRTSKELLDRSSKNEFAMIQIRQAN